MSSRRNLSPTQRITIAKKYKEKFKEQAKEKMSEFKGNQYTKVEASPIGETSKFHTDKEIAKIANVGAGTLARYDVVMKSDDEELKQITIDLSLNSAFVSAPISRPSDTIKINSRY